MRCELAREFERITEEGGFRGCVGRNRSRSGDSGCVEDVDGGEIVRLRAHGGEKPDEFAWDEMVYGLLAVKLGLGCVPADPHRGVVHEMIDRADGFRQTARGVGSGEIAGDPCVMDPGASRMEAF